MALRNIIREGDPALTKKSRAVTAFDERLHQLLDDMRETLLDANGAGLAAPQVGALRRAVLVVDTSAGEGAEESEEDSGGIRLLELINPQIVEFEGEQEGYEGCLSIPGYYGYVKRPMNVKVRAFDRYGEPIEVSGEGFLARALCHELDHLDGRLYTEIAEDILSLEEFEALLDEEQQSEEEA